TALINGVGIAEVTPVFFHPFDFCFLFGRLLGQVPLLAEAILVRRRDVALHQLAFIVRTLARLARPRKHTISFIRTALCCFARIRIERSLRSLLGRRLALLSLWCWCVFLGLWCWRTLLLRRLNHHPSTIRIVIDR